MAVHPLRTALRGASFDQIRYLAPVRPADATARVRRVYRAMEREFGVIAPPVALHAPAAPLLAASWLTLREALLVPGTAGRAAKEVVATAVSRANACPYCVTVHGATLRALPAAPAVDGALAAWADWTDRAPGGDAAPAAPTGQAGELIGVAVLFHYLNRVVNVFLGEAPMPPGAPAAALKVVAPLLARMIRSGARRVGPPGSSLELLPDAPLPADLAWAAGSPALAGAFARAAAAVDGAGERWVPDRVRALVEERLAVWDGTGPGPSRAWATDAAAALPEGERPAGRLALLTALASYQVDDTVVAAFRSVRPGDEALLGVVSWSAMAAARRVGRSMADRPT
jgi:AhpD family alkylhydroperoxidase